MWVTIVETIKDLFKYIVVILVIILLRIFVLTTTEVIGPSMLPTYTDGNIVLINQVAYKFSNANRFDIVVFKYTSPSHLIKRVIGLPGETIKYVNDELYINGEKVNEDFAHLGNVLDFEIKVSEDSYFVIGDNRDDSKDSRSFGEIKKEDIIGSPFLVIWPWKK